MNPRLQKMEALMNEVVEVLGEVHSTFMANVFVVGAQVKYRGADAFIEAVNSDGTFAILFDGSNVKEPKAKLQDIKFIAAPAEAEETSVKKFNDRMCGLKELVKEI